MCLLSVCVFSQRNRLERRNSSLAVVAFCSLLRFRTGGSFARLIELGVECAVGVYI